MYLWIAIFCAALVGINPEDQLTWLLEVARALIAVTIIAATCISSLIKVIKGVRLNLPQFNGHLNSAPMLANEC